MHAFANFSMHKETNHQANSKPNLDNGMLASATHCAKPVVHAVTNSSSRQQDMSKYEYPLGLKRWTCQTFVAHINRHNIMSCTA
eukprot:264608-Pelagomonas_calceolata.AAC.1